MAELAMGRVCSSSRYLSMDSHGWREVWRVKILIKTDYDWMTEVHIQTPDERMGGGGGGESNPAVDVLWYGGRGKAGPSKASNAAHHRFL
jgi:hypothetical protein